jgi:hypothetical protein
MPDFEEQHSQNAGNNRTAVDILRETLAVMSQRLTPEVEPATIYVPYAPVSISTSSENPE